ncbi:aromatic amino acid transport family protein [Providencia rettgeri]
MKTTDKPVNKWTYKDFTWVLSLFGTAVGAGVLFLPIKAGAGGFWPLVILALIATPMIAAILFILPVVAMRIVPAMKKFSTSALAQAFTLICGLASITSVIYGAFQ